MPKRQGAQAGALQLLALALCLILVGACSTASTSNDPADVVLRYMAAKAKASIEDLRPLLCSRLESTLQQEAASFSGVEAKVEGASCSRQGDTNVVTCTGKIVAVYGLQTTEFPLSSYNVEEEDGEWKWCGEAG